MNPLWIVYRGLLAGLVASLATAAVWALERSSEPPLVVFADGAYVMTASGHLVWPRCVEGMHWSGKTCIGEPLLVDYSGAIALVGARKKADGGRWRLPRTAELQRLVENSRHPGVLELVLSPATLGGWYWASTASVNTAPINQYNYANAMQGRTNQNANRLAFLHGWAVNMETGAARGDVSKRTKLPVRLVLSQD